MQEELKVKQELIETKEKLSFRHCLEWSLTTMVEQKLKDDCTKEGGIAYLIITGCTSKKKSTV